MVKPVNGTNITEKFFAPQNVPHTIKRCFSGVLKHFYLNLTKKSLVGLKGDYLRKKLRIKLNLFSSTSSKRKGI